MRRNEDESFYAKQPPNAGFNCEADGQVMSYVMELTSPRMVGDNLSTETRKHLESLEHLDTPRPNREE